MSLENLAGQFNTELVPSYSAQKSFYGKARIRSASHQEEDNVFEITVLSSYDTDVVTRITLGDKQVYFLREPYQAGSTTTSKHVKEFVAQGTNGDVETTRSQAIKLCSGGEHVDGNIAFVHYTDGTDKHVDSAEFEDCIRIADDIIAHEMN